MTQNQTETLPNAATPALELVPIPVIPEKLDLVAAQETVAKLETVKTFLLAALDGDDAKAGEYAVNFGTLTSKATKQVEAQKEIEFRPHKEAADAVADKYNPVIKSLTAITDATRKSYQGYLQREAARKLAAQQAEAKLQEDEALAQAEKLVNGAEGNVDAILANAQKAADEYRANGKETAARTILAQAETMVRQLRAAAAVKADKVLEAAPAAPKEAPKPTPVRTNYGAAHGRPVKEYKVVDITKVPATFLLLNDAAVRQALKDGVTDIPGLSITDGVAVSFRGR